MSMTTNHRVWPGPECLDDTTLSVRWAVAFDAGDYDECNRIVIARDEADRRSLGIAMALEAARARLWRFLLWLHEHDRHNPASRAARHLSPEAAAVDDVGRGFTWPFYLTPKWRAIAWDERTLHIHDLLASPEWASLPWQRDPSEVSRGR
jgi:hypothetical protein